MSFMIEGLFSDVECIVKVCMEYSIFIGGCRLDGKTQV